MVLKQEVRYIKNAISSKTVITCGKPWAQGMFANKSKTIVILLHFINLFVIQPTHRQETM